MEVCRAHYIAWGDVLPDGMQVQLSKSGRHATRSSTSALFARGYSVGTVGLWYFACRGVEVVVSRTRYLHSMSCTADGIAQSILPHACRLCAKCTTKMTCKRLRIALLIVEDPEMSINQYFSTHQQSPTSTAKQTHMPDAVSQSLNCSVFADESE